MEEYPTFNTPDFETLLANRIMSRNNQGETAIPTNTSDPYQMMLRKKKGETEPILDFTQQWPSEDIKALEDFCKRNGIIGFRVGKLNPKTALSMLKKQVGDFSEIPLSDRLINGYEKIGTESIGNPSFPYSTPINKRNILLG